MHRVSVQCKCTEQMKAGYGGMAGGTWRLKAIYPSNSLDVPRAVRPRAEGLSATEPPFQSWMILGWGFVLSPCSTAWGLIFCEPSYTCFRGSPAASSQPVSQGGWTSVPRQHYFLHESQKLCHKKFLLKRDFRIGCEKGFDAWDVPPCNITAGKGLICSSI